MLANVLNSVLSKMRFSFNKENSSMAGPGEVESQKTENRRTPDGCPFLAKRKTDPNYRDHKDLSDLCA